jgi:RNase adapter protein RapZ
MSGDREMLVITGMSGAGRSTAAHALEDLGWYVVDNLPPSMLPTLAELSDFPGNRERLKVAAIMDVRGGVFFADVREALARLQSASVAYRLIFLEAADEELVRRFESTRRPHPLQGDGRIVDGIVKERELLLELRGSADVVIDTTGLNVHQLQEKIERLFSDDGGPGLRTTILSFGYKYGLPYDADLVVDCRFIPNPHWIPELRPLTGQDPAVKENVLSRPGTKEFVEHYVALFRIIAEGYRREGKRYVTLAVGCTGGKHRSVAVAEHLAALLQNEGTDVTTVHRDLGRE